MTAKLMAVSGFPVEMTEDDLTGTVGAMIQMPENHDPSLFCHLEAPELTHLRMETEARKVGRNRFFTTRPEHREEAMRAVASDLRRFSRNGYSEDSLTGLFENLIGGLCSFVYNCPLDMLIERSLREDFPALRPSQFLSVRTMANGALAANQNRDILKVTPRKIYQAVLAMNGAYCLELDDLYAGATAFADPYRKMDNFSMARRLHDHWTSKADSLTLGDEYDLVDEFAAMLGIRGWFDWIPDVG
jgi:hypothetical protein